jgi:tetratricopeptide (TPR) repeat protein
MGIAPFLALMTNRGQALLWTGRLGEAQRVLDRVLELAAGDAGIETRRHSHELYCKWARIAGDTPLAAGHVRQLLEIAERTGTARARVEAYGELGALQIVEGQWREAVETLEAALAIAREKRTWLHHEASLMAVLAEAYLGAGDADLARATASAALAVSRRQRNRMEECLAHLALARVLLRGGSTEASSEIEAALDSARACVEETGATTLVPFIHVERAALARLCSDDDTRERELREAHRLFTEMGVSIRAADVAREIAG